MILAKVKYTNLVRIDKFKCGCVNRYTHGLPYTHETAEIIKEGCPISLSFVHPHWMKLDMVKKFDKVSFHLNLDAKWLMKCKRFSDSDEAGKLALKIKLREFSGPSTIFLVPPIEKVKTNGCSTSKVDKSTQCEPSYFEIDESTYDTISIRKLATGNSTKVIKKRKTCAHNPPSKMQYKGCFLTKTQQYVVDIIDVKENGHFGFKSIIGLVGFGDYNCSKVQEDLIDELYKFRGDYVSMYGSNTLVDELLQTLSCFETSTSSI
ncbi:hypothetical protein PTKIN_Ptkin15bG0089800 [Pterospermum kingtungense]